MGQCVSETLIGGKGSQGFTSVPVNILIFSHIILYVKKCFIGIKTMKGDTPKYINAESQYSKTAFQ